MLSMTLQGLNIPARSLVLIRGLPGSGKSTLAKRLAAENGLRHLEADFHFEGPSGYRHDPARLADAHAWCRREAYQLLTAGIGVVVANTFVRIWELVDYVGIATVLEIPFTILEASGRWPNIHNVPGDVMAKMTSQWESLPPSLQKYRKPASTYFASPDVDSFSASK